MYKANKDVYCPHTGRLLFAKDGKYKDISQTSYDVVLETYVGCEVGSYTITGDHANLEGFFDVVVEQDFERTFSNRKGGIGDLEIRANRLAAAGCGVDIFYSSPYHCNGEKYFAAMGASTCLELGQYWLDLAKWIEEGS